MEIGKFEPIKWDYQDISYGPDNSQVFDIKIPKDKKAAPGIVYIHGGAYLVGDKSEYLSFLTDFAKDNVVATINYRVIKENNFINIRDMILDINSALFKIAELSKENGVYIENFILVGHSAGGLITPGGSGDNHNLGGVVYAANTPFVFEKQAWVREAVEWMEGYLG